MAKGHVRLGRLFFAKLKHCSREGAKRVSMVADAEKQARAAFMESLGNEMIPALPRYYPVKDDRSNVTGNIDELPWITLGISSTISKTPMRSTGPCAHELVH